MFRTLLAFTWLAVMANDIVAQAPSIRAYKNRIAPHWFDNNDHFWYRNDLRGETREFILVDAVRGVRQRAFHHTELANALRASGIDEAAPDRLPIEDLEFNLAEKQLQFRADGRLWRCDLEDYRLEEVSATQVNAASDDAPGRLEVLPRLSRNTGAEIELRFVNQTDRVLTLYWLDTGGQRQPYGELKPGAEHRQHTYAGHVWLAVDAQENVVAAFEGQENPVAAIIKDGVAPRQPARRRNRNRRQSTRFQTSPDEKWLAQVSGGNVVIVNRETQAERPLTDQSPTQGIRTTDSSAGPPILVRSRLFATNPESVKTSTWSNRRLVMEVAPFSTSAPMRYLETNSMRTSCYCFDNRKTRTTGK